MALAWCGAIACSTSDNNSLVPAADGSTTEDGSTIPPDARPDLGPDESQDAGPATDSADGAADASTTTFIAFSEGSPASVFWDDDNQILYIADNANNQIWKWTDFDGLAKYVTTLDPGGAALEAGATLVGQVVRLDDGTLLVARFGQPRGGFAAIAYVLSDGGQGLVPGVDPTRKHLGIGFSPGNEIYGSYFFGIDGGTVQTGAVTRVDLQGGETDYATGFGKIIGVVVANGSIYVSDQQANAIYSWPLSGLVPEAGAWPVFATLPRPDQLCVGPDGTFFTGQFQGAPGSTAPLAVRQIAPDGTVSVFKQDPDVSKPSGVAYDPTHRRLFVADTGNAAMIGVHVFAVP